MIRALVAAVAMMIVAMSCLVDRRSDEFACEEDADCVGLDGARECTDGYCTRASCPSICDGGCGPNKACTIECESPNECRNGVTCPSGYTCIFKCTEDCTPVSCPLGCTVECADSTADCGPINCGAGATCSCSGIGTCI